MKDTVIKGSGNSRSMKTVPNAPIIYPDFATFIQEFASNGIPFDMGPLDLNGVLEKGTDLNKANLLSDETAALLGLGSAAVPDDALIVLHAFLSGMAQIRVTVKDASGKPFVNIPVAGLSDPFGNTPILTNESGFALGYAMSGRKTFSTENILDITSVSNTISVSAGGVYYVELIPMRRNFALFDSSISELYITDAVNTVDVSAVSGGGNGAPSIVLSSGSRSGAGGNTGTSTIRYEIDVTEKGGGFVSLIVGGPGGGTSKFLGVEAAVAPSGGALGVELIDTLSRSGLPGSDANYKYFSSYTEESPCGGNGGSGGISATYDYNAQGGAGGAPFGGSGGSYNNISTIVSAGSNATGYGGAGGGGGVMSSMTKNGGSGYKGVVSVRIHFKEGITV